MTYLAFFDAPEPGVEPRVGGKGANLIALTAAGFPVPPGFVVTVDAYLAFLDQAAWLEHEVEGLDHARPERLHVQCAEIRRRLAQTPLPLAVGDEIRAALEQPAFSAGSPPAFAVRSSSTFEDLAEAAFAGQHDTYLNVRGSAVVQDRVRDCFASLWEDRAVLYRHHHGFAQSAARMAVVVQLQVASEVAGVAFSVDPVGGRMDRLVVDANYGLGESVVSGACAVDHFELDKPSLQIVHRAIGHKSSQTVATEHGVDEGPVAATLADQPCLDDERLGDVGRLLQRVEAHYGWPQDIEWGWAGGKLYLFQSRPVTTVPPQWTRDESAERFPNAMTPLCWDFMSEAFGASLTHSLALMGLPRLRGKWFEIFDHYVYGDQNAVRLLGMYRPLRARSLAELEADIPRLREQFAWVMDLPVNWARDLDRYLIRLGRLEAAAEPQSLEEGWRFVNDALGVATEYFLPNIAISMTQTILHRVLLGLVTAVVGAERAVALVDGLLAGCETKTTIVNREIHELAMLASSFPELRRGIVEDGGQAVIRDGRVASHPEFAARFRRFLEDHGHREVDIDYSQPTWSGQPWVVLDSIALMLRQETLADPAETARAQRIRQAETEQQFLAAVPDSLRFFFRELIRLARTYTVLDDLEHYETTRINPLAHRGALALGRLLRGLGVLELESDVFYLDKPSLAALVADPSEAQQARCREVAVANKRSFEQARKRTPDWSRGTSVDAPPEASAKVHRGLPGSPGRATGPCFVVHGPEDFGRFPPRAVLVARTTNPAWTPLFYSAIAVVTESGGPLSHGAVTAREMGLPAVMSVRGALSLLRDGQMVLVDGSAGSVELIS
jgi:pyruvate,water dikinase